MSVYKAFLLALTLLLSACAGNSSQDGNPISNLAKGPIDTVIEIHQQQVMADLQMLMLKLYKRNPMQRHDLGERALEHSVARVFDGRFVPQEEAWLTVVPTDLIRMSLKPTYEGDRVLAYIFGLKRMLMASYDNHENFYYTTSIDAQKLYNSARNLEIAAWLIAEKRDDNGKRLLISDTMRGDVRNLSFQRLWGRMIATQDNLSLVMARKTDRVIKTVVVQAASMVFLPI